MNAKGVEASSGGDDIVGPGHGHGKGKGPQVARTSTLPLFCLPFSCTLDSWLYQSQIAHSLNSSAAKSETYQVDTTDILFILSGAFVGLDKVVQQRMSKGVRPLSCPCFSV